MKTSTTWSYSQYSTWAQCPHKAKLQYIDRIPVEPSDAMKRGSAIHKEIEQYLTQRTEVPSSAFLIDKQVRHAARQDPEVEVTWGFDRAWNPCDPFGPDRWLKVILDVHYITRNTEATVIDWKTGKVRPENHAPQMGLYALASMLKHRGVKKVTTKLVYVDFGVSHTTVFTRSEVGEMRAQWDRVVGMMERDTIFPKKPNYLCKWCPFSGTEHCEF